MDFLAQDDPELARLVAREARRIEETLDLVASESHAPPSVFEVLGSVLHHKTVEGYPGRRFHAGCRHADAVERLAVDRCRALFGADHANVQPHSGTSANLAVYFSVLEPGDRILSMGLAAGGHLSHGHRASITGKCFRFAHYGVDPDTEVIDMDAVREAARGFRPRMIVAGASSYARAIDYPAFADIAREAGAWLFVDLAHTAGLVAGGVLPSPVPHADFVTFTCYKTLMAGRGGVVLCRAAHADRVDRAVFPGCQGTSAVDVIAAKALCFARAARGDFRALQERIAAHARLLAAELSARGHRIVSGGTDTHQVLVDLASCGMDGREAQDRLEAVGILVNRNVIPRDADAGGRTGGIRLGTTAATARGMGPAEMRTAAELIDRVLRRAGDPGVPEDAASEVAALCRRFPVYRKGAAPAA